MQVNFISADGGERYGAGHVGYGYQETVPNIQLHEIQLTGEREQDNKILMKSIENYIRKYPTDVYWSVLNLMVKAMLKVTNCNVSKACRMLDVNRNKMYRWFTRLGIAVDRDLNNQLTSL